MPRKAPDTTDKADAAEGKREFLDALANGLQLMSAFNEDMRVVTIQSAAELLGVTRPASRRILLTLAELGYLQQRERFFSLAPKAIELGYRYFRSLGLAASVRPHLQALSRELDVGAALGVLAGTDVLFIERVEATRLIKLDLRAGDRLPAHAHSLGRALLAELPPDALAPHLPAGPIHRISPRTLTGREELMKELARVRQRGWSFVNSELVAGLFGVAIALPSASGRATVGLNVTSIGEPWTQDDVERRIVPALRACAQAMRPITDSMS
jgi:IclR family pca regulon transcriptional regulator